MDMEGCMIKKGLTWFGIVVLILLACIGLHRSVLWVEHATIKSMIEARENDRFDKDLISRREGGYPLFLVNPEHT